MATQILGIDSKSFRGEHQAERRAVVCIAEDRQSCEPALRILIASMDKHCPGLSAYLYCPNPTLEFSEWIKGFGRHRLIAEPLTSAGLKYDVKPVALLETIASGHSEVIWLDSDIVVTRDFREIFASLPRNMVAVSEEALCSGHSDPDGLRARLWGFPVGRILPYTVNTGVLRVCATHTRLLERWNELLKSTSYREAQDKPWNERGLHLMGDQEVLTALLASEEFSDFPIYYLKRGAAIVQFFGNAGYTVRERLSHIRHGLPFFIHSQGFRPWWPRATRPHNFAGAFKHLYDDLSPYSAIARSYPSALTEVGWLRPKSRLARAIIAMFGDRPALIGLPLAIVSDAQRLLKRWFS